MKEGDKVWIFRGDGLIHQVKIAQIDDDCIWCDDPGRPAIRLNKDYPMFPTREALCEHYRKIFE
jgi:hypothetical protein